MQKPSILQSSITMLETGGRQTSEDGVHSHKGTYCRHLHQRFPKDTYDDIRGNIGLKLLTQAIWRNKEASLHHTK